MDAKIALLVLLVSFLFAAAPARAHAEHRGFRATMIGRTEGASSINFTLAARQSRHWLSMLTSRLDTASSSAAAQTPLKMDGAGAYDMEISIGTPPQKLTAVADTGSDLIWTKCGACASCEPQGSPSYYPDKSSSFSKLSCAAHLCDALQHESNSTSCGAGGAECDYKYSYGFSDDNDHYTQGYLGTETITIGGDAAPDIAFGCTTMAKGFDSSSGLVGLGRGPVSLVSQLDARAFSYCLTRDASKASPLLFGSLATLSGSGVQSTPLVPDSVFYTVGLLGISIGSTRTSGIGHGVVFDSGTTLTYLEDPAYTEAKEAVTLQMGLTLAPGRDGFEACFYDEEANDVAVPSMVLHFGGGADMTLAVPNYFVNAGDGVVCWIVQKSTGVSIIGNVMQTDFHVMYDVDDSVLSFQPAKCDSLSGSARLLLSKFEGVFVLTVLHVLYTVSQLVF
ncbi:unnamed protein product [Urochloa decumbens]|uniref:Peptidase A1 domain-containing protein n=1 Tax=Urochloa decumbens TaxID=240449 RepID=A0ABC9B654_9POAL